MWISEDGRGNSNAWADPSAVLPEAVMDLIASLTADERAALAESLLDASLASLGEIATFADSTTPDREAEFVRAWMPADAIEHLAPATTGQLLDDLARLDLRWRIDAYDVVESYVASFDSNAPGRRGGSAVG